jgi:RHS repeat-associated protein
VSGAAKPVGVTATRFYRHGTALVGVRSGSTGTAVDGLSWVVTDRQGTITATVPAGSTSGSVNRYRPFGTNRAGDAIGVTARGFLACSEDPDGLVATDHRLYDPSIGRFLTIDPSTKDQSPGTTIERGGSPVYARFDNSPEFVAHAVAN